MTSEMHFSEWIGRSETSMDFVDESRVAKLFATFNTPCPDPIHEQALPALWHWMFFAPVVPFGELGNDGHPERGGFLPPVDLPRRMWAGGRLEFFRQIEVGNKIRRVSSIKDIVAKKGRTGEMVFVTVAHQILDDHGVLINEEQDIVYRELVPPDASTPSYKTSDESSDFSAEIFPNPVTLFRYSALTFNGHRIHYDRTYATEIEGYPGLVVHGPLLATMLSLFAERKTGKKLSKFSFRGKRPIFDLDCFTLTGSISGKDSAEFRVLDHQSQLSMSAEVEFKKI